MKKLRLIVLVVLFAVVTRSCEFFPALHSPEEFIGNYEVPPTSNPSIADGERSARILVTNLIPERNITSITTTKPTEPAIILAADEKILPRHEKSAWVEYADELNFTFRLENTIDGSIEEATLRKPLQLYHQSNFTKMYLYRNNKGEISISPDPYPSDPDPGILEPLGYNAWIEVYNKTKLIPINDVTFNRTEIDPTSLGVVSPGSRGIAHTRDGLITLNINYGGPVASLDYSCVLLADQITKLYFYKYFDGTFRLEDYDPPENQKFDEGPVTPPTTDPGYAEVYLISSGATLSDNIDFGGYAQWISSNEFQKSTTPNTLRPGIYALRVGGDLVKDNILIERDKKYSFTLSKLAHWAIKEEVSAPIPEVGYSLTVINLTGSTTITEITYSGTTAKTLAVPPGDRKITLLPNGIIDFNLSWNQPQTVGYWLAGSGTLTGQIEIAPIAKVNKLYFYRNLNGDFVFGQEGDESIINNNINPGDISLNISSDYGNNVKIYMPGGDGSEDEEIRPPSNLIHTTGVVKVINLSKKNITKVIFADGAGNLYSMRAIRANNHSRSIVVAKSPPDWTITATFNTGTAAITLNVLPYGQWGNVNEVYFYKSRATSGYVITDTLDPDDVDPEAGAPPSTGGGNEGDYPGVLPTVPNGLGLVVVKNVSPTTDIDEIEFSSGPSGHGPFTMAPGPTQANLQTILLYNGTWTATATYLKNSAPTTSQPKNFTVSNGQERVIYFYLKTNGTHGISDVWPPLPNDAASGNVDPGTVIGENEGWLHIVNGSLKGTIISKIRWKGRAEADTLYKEMDFPDHIALNPGNSTTPNLIMTEGNITIQYYDQVNMTYSRNDYITIIRNQIVNGIYTDALEDDGLPIGFGRLLVNNQTSLAVQSISFTDRSGKIYNNQGVEITTPQGFQVTSRQSNQMNVKNGEYAITFYFEGVPQPKLTVIRTISSNFISVTLNDENIEPPGGGGSGSNPELYGSLTVKNDYRKGVNAVRPDFKIFRYYLYKPTTVGGATYSPGTSTRQYAYDTTAEMEISAMCNDTLLPTPSQSPESRLITTGSYSPIGIGENATIYRIKPGFYKLVVVAGSYSWTDYNQSPSTVINGVSLNKDLISYDCGEIYIAAGTEYPFSFDRYGRENDIPTGYVTFSIVYTGPGAAYVPKLVEVVSIKRSLWSAQGADVITMLTGTKLQFSEASTTTVNKIKNYSFYPGSWSNSSAGPYSLDADRVFVYTESMSSGGGAGPFMIPPGVYWTRYSDNHATGYAYGSSTSAWRIVDLRWSGRQNVALSMDDTVGTNWTLVNQKPGGVASGTLLPDVNGDWPGNTGTTVNVVIDANKIESTGVIVIHYKLTNSNASLTWANLTSTYTSSFNVTLTNSNKWLHIRVQEDSRTVSKEVIIDLSTGAYTTHD
jgi:hypothetical protein